ncbi:sensor histidine kinase [Luteibacter aegosomatissinici]|uniref:sensor histidine kinase n=1 Tax=Luteibacter aegosomatissinici TaxID=2911539 RepID=UPI001FF71A7B|nr:histidine kinase [Luteibacter aegosomatissinici]UPG96641.1 histidine kinase [Luteibacter aegosomatissinici]
MANRVGQAVPPAWRRRALWLWVALLVLIGLLRASNRFLIDVANGHATPFVPPLIEELTGSLSFGACLPLLFAALRRIPRSPWAHAGVFIALSVAQTTLMIASRQVVFRLVGLPGRAYGITVWRYLMEVPTQLFFYAVIVVGVWLFDRYREGREREVRNAQLESALSEARLEALRLQLNPHFLFNTLNAVSELMYERPRVADEMLARVGELLRATLAAAGQEHALREEWRLLDLYLDIQRARFGAGLDADLVADEGLADVRVPFLILQPLVENAIEHGGVGDARFVRVAAVSDGGRAVITVRDGGGGGGGGSVRPGHGIGMGNVQARLRHLYGDEAGVQRDAAGTGSVVTLWLPIRRGDAP